VATRRSTIPSAHRPPPAHPLRRLAGHRPRRAPGRRRPGLARSARRIPVGPRAGSRPLARARV